MTVVQNRSIGITRLLPKSHLPGNIVTIIQGRFPAEGGADVHATNTEGATALLHAADWGHADCATLFLPDTPGTGWRGCRRGGRRWVDSVDVHCRANQLVQVTLELTTTKFTVINTKTLIYI